MFNDLLRRGQIVVHASDVERIAALAEAGAAGDLVIADRREQVADLNAAIRDQRLSARGEPALVTSSGEQLSIGDRVATRRNDPELQVANRQTWTVARITDDGWLVLRGRGREKEVPAEYAARYVELAYATTVHGAQGDTVGHADVALSETTGAAAAYVAMTRGRKSNTAHLVAETLQEARQQWIDAFSRDRRRPRPCPRAPAGDRSGRPVRRGRRTDDEATFRLAGAPPADVAADRNRPLTRPRAKSLGNAR